MSVGDATRSIWSVERDGSQRGPWVDKVAQNGLGLLPRLYLDGDSRSDTCSSTGRTSAQGWLFWLQLLTRGRFDFRPEWNNGVGGQDSEDMLARMDNLKPLPPAVVVAICGTNERTRHETARWTIDRAVGYQNGILDMGHRLVWIAETPRGDTTHTDYTLASPDLDYHLRYRQHLLDQSGVRGVHVADPFSLMADPALANGRAKDTVLRDGIHAGAYGGHMIATTLVPIIESLFPLRPLLPASNADLYSTSNPTGSLSANPMMLGTGGTVGSGCTGTLASNWKASAGPGLSATLSKITDSNGNVWQQIVVTGAPTATTVAIDGVQPASKDSAGNIDPTPVSVVISVDLDPTKIAVSDVFDAVCEVEIDSGSTGLRGVALYTEYTTPAGRITQAAGQPDLIQTQENLDFPPVDLRGVLIVPQSAPMPGSVIGARTYLVISGANNSTVKGPLAIAATVRVRAVKTRKIQNIGA